MDGSAVELAARIRSRELSPVEVVDAAIARIEQVNPALNAVVATCYGEARAAAVRAEARAREPDPPPLLGVPCTIKEFLAVRGMPHTAGLRARRHVVADRDSTVVRRLTDAGAIVMGVTNAPEGGLWHETNNPLYGRTRNPHDPSRTPGGSSGGEAAIIAAGGVPFGIGSDTGGSIRLPAGFCGIVGHKPTGGLVPATGHFPSAPGEGDVPMAIGPMARSIGDLSLVLRVIAGPDGIDPQCVRTLPSEEEIDWREITVWPLATDGRFRAAPGIVAAVEKAGFALQERGATLGRWTGPDLSGAFEAWAALLAETGASYADIVGGGRSPRAVRELLRWPFGRAHHSGGVIAILLLETLLGRLGGREERARGARALREAFDRAVGPRGLVIHPIYPSSAPRHRAIALRDPRDVGCTALFNVTESPVTAVHVDTDPQGLPIGVQVAGARGADGLTLAAGRVLEERFGTPAPRSVRGSGSPR